MAATPPCSRSVSAAASSTGVTLALVRSALSITSSSLSASSLVLGVRIENQVIDPSFVQRALDVDQAERAVAARRPAALDGPLDEVELPSAVSLRNGGVHPLQHSAPCLGNHVNRVGQIDLGALLGSLVEFTDVLGITEANDSAPAAAPRLVGGQPARLLEEARPIVLEPLVVLVTAGARGALGPGHV